MSLLLRMPPFLVRQGIEWRRDALAAEADPEVRQQIAQDLATLEAMA